MAKKEKAKKNSEAKINSNNAETNSSSRKQSKDSAWVWASLIFIIPIATLAIWWVNGLEVAEPIVVEQKETQLRYKTFEEVLKDYPDHLREYLAATLSKEEMEEVEQIPGFNYAPVKVFKDISPKFDMSLINQFVFDAKKVIYGNKWNLHDGLGSMPFKDHPLKNQLSILGQYLVEDKKFIYSTRYIDFDGTEQTPSGSFIINEKGKKEDNPEPYLLYHLLTTGQGNCSTMPMAYTILAKSMGLPVHLVTIGEHQFCRYDDGTTKINIESTNPEAMGPGEPDINYIRAFPVSPKSLQRATMLSSQNLRQSISTMYSAKVAYLALKKADKNEIIKAVASSLYFDKNSAYAVRNMHFLVSQMKELDNKAEIIKELENMGREIGVIAPDMREINNSLASFQHQLATLKTDLNSLFDMQVYKPQLGGGRSLKEVQLNTEKLLEENKARQIRDESLRYKKLEEIKRKYEQIALQSKNNIESTKSKILNASNKLKENVSEFLTEYQGELPQKVVDAITQISIENGQFKNKVLQYEQNNLINLNQGFR